jgi:hypothetical protein
MRPCEELVRRVLRISQVPEDPRVSGSSGRYSDPSHPAGNLVPCANQIHFQEGFGRSPSSRKICGQYCNFGVVILSRTLAQGAPFSHWGHSVIFQSDTQGLKGMWHTVGCVRRSKEKWSKKTGDMQPVSVFKGKKINQRPLVRCDGCLIMSGTWVRSLATNSG